MGAGLLAAPLAAEAQPSNRMWRIGVVLEGGPYVAALDGLRAGLTQLGFEEGKQYVLDVRDTQSDLRAVGPAARALEAEKVDVIYAVTTSVTLAVKQATTRVPIVFYAGGDPVAAGLVTSIRKPGGRLTGMYGQVTNLTEKRVELLKDMVPGIRRIVTFYNHANPISPMYRQVARDAARHFNIELLARPVTSTEELRASLRALKPGMADAHLVATDVLIISHADLIIDAARSMKMPTMFADKGSVVRGGLACYGVNYYTAGRSAARYVQRVLQGADPGDLPVEQFNEPSFVINIKTAMALGLTIPQWVLLRADEVIQ
jgi:putative ABC transport system substrate-binding protein